MMLKMSMMPTMKALRSGVSACGIRGWSRKETTSALPVLLLLLLLLLLAPV
jgi:hypothetical protein